MRPERNHFDCNAFKIYYETIAVSAVNDSHRYLRTNLVLKRCGVMTPFWSIQNRWSFFRCNLLSRCNTNVLQLIRDHNIGHNCRSQLRVISQYSSYNSPTMKNQFRPNLMVWYTILRYSVMCTNRLYRVKISSSVLFKVLPCPLCIWRRGTVVQRKSFSYGILGDELPLPIYLPDSIRSRITDRVCRTGPTHKQGLHTSMPFFSLEAHAPSRIIREEHPLSDLLDPLFER